MSLPLLHAGKSAPGLSAALDLRFALDKSLTAYRGPTPSFSRASTGSYFDGSGVLRYANVNILTYSENFSDASWLKNSTTISSDSVIAPDGKTTADTLTSTSSTAIHYLEKTGYTVSTVQYTISIFAKYGTHRYLQISANNESSGVYANFDLVSGVVGSVGASATSQITNVGGGWYRCSMTYTATNTASRPLLVMVSSSTASRVESITLTSGDYFYIWGCQQEASSTVGTYCPTTSSANSAPRFNHTYNGTSWVSKGLLVEEQRTNAFQWSEDFSNAFWTKLNASIATSSGISPDGTNTANKITDDSTNGTHRIYRGNVGTADQPCTTSFYLKAGTARYAIVLNSDNNDWRAYAVADLQTGTITQNGVMVATTGASYIGSSITNCGDGWYRVSVSGTNRSGDANYYGQVALSNSATPGTIPSYIGTGSYIYAVMAQMELNSSFPTSYIKTTSSTVTRSADVCQITGSDFSGFWNGTEGSVACEFDVSSGYTSSAMTIVNFYQSGSSWIGFRSIESTSNNVFDCYSGGVQQARLGFSRSNPGISARLAAAFKANDFAASQNGSAVLTDTSGSLPSPTYLELGTFTGFGEYLNGHIARLRYYNKRLPNATLQQLST